MAANSMDPDKRAAAFQNIFSRPQPSQRPAGPVPPRQPVPPHPQHYSPQYNHYYQYAPPLPPAAPSDRQFSYSRPPSNLPPHAYPPQPHPSYPSQSGPSPLPYRAPPPPSLHLPSSTDNLHVPPSPTPSVDTLSSSRPYPLDSDANLPSFVSDDHEYDSGPSPETQRPSHESVPSNEVVPPNVRSSSESDRASYYEQQYRLSSAPGLPYPTRTPSFYENSPWPPTTSGASLPPGAGALPASAPVLPPLRTHTSNMSTDSGRASLVSRPSLQAPSLDSPWSPTYDRPLPHTQLQVAYPPPSPQSAYDFNARSSAQSNRPISSVSVHSFAHSPSHSARRNVVAGPLYPALLSCVSEFFRSQVALGERVKDGLAYASAFTGAEAVSVISDIIATEDRNLALLLGRALDAQRFFHDVAYEHRLRDSHNEVYRLRDRLGGGFVNGEDAIVDPHQAPRLDIPTIEESFEDDQLNQASAAPTTASSSLTLPPERIPSSPGTEDSLVPNGVFTLLTDCYSPTCSKRNLCYSCACPRRLEQLKYLGQTDLSREESKGLQRQESSESLNEQPEPGTLWVHSVPKEVFDSVDDKEKRRQEAINEVIYTERDFVRDLEYLRDKWMKPLRTGTIIDTERRDDFVTQVFWNVLDILSINSKLCDALNKRQKQHYVVNQIGDVLLDHVGNFSPFVAYGSHQLYGKYEFEKEKSSNSDFSQFVDETERLPESRKLELNGYLTKPTTRLARYPLLLEVVMKNTPEDHPDKTHIPEVIKIVRQFLSDVNIETGKAENRFELAQLDQQLVFRQAEQMDLRLRDPNRELIHKGPLKKRGGGNQGESAELLIILFDHALILTKPKDSAGKTTLKVYRKPIPLQLLVIASPEEGTGRGTSRQKALMPRASSSKSTVPTTGKENSKSVPPMVITHLGRKGYSMTLYAATNASRKKWLEKIEEQQNVIKSASTVIETYPVFNRAFPPPNRLTSAAPFDRGNKIVYGTETGVFLQDLRSDRAPIRVIVAQGVSQVDVLEDFGLLVILADKAIQTFMIDSLSHDDAPNVAKRARKYTAATSFFKVGICSNRTIVCTAKTSAQTTTIKVFEPMDHHARSKKQPGLRKLLNNANQEHLKASAEFYINKPFCNSLSFLKGKICVGHQEGYDIVDFATLETQVLLDPEDSSLDFLKRAGSSRPMAIFRVDNEFLLCYSDFGFYVNSNGWRTQADFFIVWEGSPQSFALFYPYVLAFDPSFVEVRSGINGALLQVVVGENMKSLFADSSLAASAPPNNPAYYDQQLSLYQQSRYGPPRPSMYGMPPQPPPPSMQQISSLAPNRRSHIIYLSSGDKAHRVKIAPRSDAFRTSTRKTSNLSVSQSSRSTVNLPARTVPY